MTDFPCKCHVSGNGIEFDAICHGLGLTKCKHPYAIVEKLDGSVVILKLDETYLIKLIRD